MQHVLSYHFDYLFNHRAEKGIMCHIRSALKRFV